MGSSQKGDPPKNTDRVKMLDNTCLDRHIFNALLAKGLIDRPTRQASLTWLHPSHLWARWAEILLIAFGLALVLAGIIFFFAFNWNAIPPLARLAMIEGGMVLTIALAFWQGLDGFIGKLALLSGSVLVGVFMAVFGQIYQTGADAWQLFALWSVLILPWTLLSRFAIQWLVWLLLVNLAVVLWWDQDFRPGTHEVDYLATLLALINLLALAIRDIWGRAGKRVSMSFLKAAWIRWLLAFAVLAYLFAPLLSLFIDRHETDASRLVPGPIAILVYAGFFYYYRFKAFDIPVLALWSLAVSVLITVTIGDMVHDADIGDIPAISLTALAAITVFAASAGYLRRLLAQADAKEVDHV